MKKLESRLSVRKETLIALQAASSGAALVRTTTEPTQNPSLVSACPTCSACTAPN